MNQNETGQETTGQEIMGQETTGQQQTVFLDRVMLMMLADAVDKSIRRGILRSILLWVVVSQFLITLAIVLGLGMYIRYRTHETIEKHIDGRILSELRGGMSEIEGQIHALKERAKKAERELAEAMIDVQNPKRVYGDSVGGDAGGSDHGPGLPTGWTFFAEKYEGSKNFRIQTFKVVQISSTSPAGRSTSYPYRGDQVQCIRTSQYVRTGPPTESGLSPVAGIFRQGDRGYVTEVLEIIDSMGNDEVWIEIEPVD